jgi:methionyl-tRNA synthetase
LQDDVAHAGIKTKLREWLDADGGLRDWDISRDAPYFGFPIPGAPGKYFYVWLDAPIGYLSSFQALCERNGLDFDAFLDAGRNAGGETELHHFLGKDIVNFHGLFWPAVLHGAGFRAPSQLHVNGYLTVNGAKMSKSRGTFIMARSYLDAGLAPEALRYYFASKSGAGVADLDLNLEDFTAKVNSELVGKYVNIASRAAGFVNKIFNGRLNSPSDADLSVLVSGKREEIQSAYAEGELSKVTRLVMELADEVNRQWDENKPWLLAKDDGRKDELHAVCSDCLRAFYVLSVYLSPIIPGITAKVMKFFNMPMPERFFDDLSAPKIILPNEIAEYEHLFTRIDPKHIQAMIDASKDTTAAAPTGDAKPAKSVEPNKTAAVVDSAPGTIGIDDFAKLDLRIGKVLECGFVDGSDKLLRFLLDAGDLGQRQIFSGIRGSYGEPEKLVGRKVVFIANLAPRKMRFGISEGMILSAGGDDALFLLDADAGAKSGDTVK